MVAQQSSYRYYYAPEDDGLQEDYAPTMLLDTMLFRLANTIDVDYYGDATKYYKAQSALKRRGVGYWTLNDFLNLPPVANKGLEQSPSSSSVALYSAYGYYTFGGAARFSHNFDSGWSLRSSVDVRSGRDAYVRGLFRNDVYLDMELSRRWDTNHYLQITLDGEYKMRSQQYSTTSEVYELVGSNFYNPAWGYYHGKERSARVNYYTEPQIDIRYQRPIADYIFSVSGEISGGEQRRGSLGYYNAYTPLPDHYTKLPSYYDYGTSKDYVTSVWRSGDAQYTQIAWDNLEQYNLTSATGEAHYIVESKVVDYLNVTINAMVADTKAEGVDMEWGLEAYSKNSINYKEVDDLLGAEYHLDMDYLIGDVYNLSNKMQNDLANPNRQVGEGESFGYRYSLFDRGVSAVGVVRGTVGRLDYSAMAKIGAGEQYRVGHYEKERYVGTASLGRSKSWGYTPINVRGALSYAVAAKHRFNLQGSYIQSPPQSYDIFFDIEDANALSGASMSKSGMLSLSYLCDSERVTFNIAAYALLTRDGFDLFPMYDDISSQMARATVEGLSTNSLGVEAVLHCELSPKWKMSTTLSAASYRYASNPSVTLYSDINLSEVAATSPSYLKGLIVGNTPQLAATTSLTYSGFRYCYVGINGSVSGFRYVEPSSTRRTARVYNYVHQLAQASWEGLTEQEPLDNIYDLELSVTRFIWFDSGGRLMVRISCRNLLGEQDRVSYARESNRLQSTKSSDLIVAWSGQPTQYRYSSGRTMYLNLTYSF